MDNNTKKSDSGDLQTSTKWITFLILKMGKTKNRDNFIGYINQNCELICCVDDDDDDTGVWFMNKFNALLSGLYKILG